MRKNSSVRNMAFAAVIAAVYAVLTVALPVPQYGGIQVRFAEALTILPGLFVGCIIANMFSPFPLDILFGSLATLVACMWTQRMPNRWLAPLPPVLCNAVIIGFEVAWATTGLTDAFWPAYAFNAFTVGFGELLACYGLGSIPISAISRSTFFRGRMDIGRHTA